MIIIFDFDDALFDRKGKFTAACAKVGINLARGNPLYESCKTDGNYDYKKHIKLIAQGDRQREKKLLANMEKIFQSAPDLLFPNAVNLLKKFHRRYRLMLATKGKIDFQKKKVENSGLEHFFEKIFFGERYKADFLADKIKGWHSQGEKIIFLDDSPKEIKLMRQKFPYVTARQVEPGKLDSIVSILSAPSHRS